MEQDLPMFMDCGRILVMDIMVQVKSDNSQFRITAVGSADIGDHAISLGFEYEQRTDRYFGVAPMGLWTLMRQLANSHTDYGRGIDESQPIITTLVHLLK